MNHLETRTKNKNWNIDTTKKELLLDLENSSQCKKCELEEKGTHQFCPKNALQNKLNISQGTHKDPCPKHFLTKGLWKRFGAEIQ